MDEPKPVSPVTKYDSLAFVLFPGCVTTGGCEIVVQGTPDLWQLMTFISQFWLKKKNRICVFGYWLVLVVHFRISQKLGTD